MIENTTSNVRILQAVEGALEAHEGHPDALRCQAIEEAIGDLFEDDLVLLLQQVSAALNKTIRG